MFPSIKFGKLLNSASDFYTSGQYDLAKAELEKALLINKNDFTANFLKLRLVAMQGEWDLARSLIPLCQKLKPRSAENLLEPWEKLLANPAKAETDIITLNEETDKLIEYYQHKREYRLLDIIYVFLLLTAVEYIFLFLRHFNIVPKELDHGIMMANTILLMFTPIILYYYYKKAILVPNIYIAFRYTLDKIHLLLHSKKFQVNLFIIIFGMILSQTIFRLIIHKSGRPPFDENLLNFVATISLFPIAEELFFRGFLYGYLKKIGKTVSWTLVALLFYFYHANEASYWHIILSLVCLQAYDQEDTILAPILIHTFNNVLATLAVYIFGL